MRALTTKLMRDLRHLAGPALAVALVVASGVTAYVTMRGGYLSISEARDAFYARARFGDVFARLTRAPRSVVARLEALPDVAVVQARVVEDVIVDVPGFIEPVRAHLMSTRQDAALNALLITRGRAPQPHAQEVVVGEAFGLAHDLDPGDHLWATVAGNKRRFDVVGVGVSPEAVYLIPPGGAWPDDERYGALWMHETSLAAALGMIGAFNDVVIALRPGAASSGGAAERVVIDAVERVLAPWGSLGAQGRSGQQSHRFIDEELRQLNTQTYVTPLIFLGVAALILHMVLSRLVESQREIIALLKAIGYRNRAIAWHYVQLALVIVVVGSALGVLGGLALGDRLIALYRDYFRFDELGFSLQPENVAVAFALSVGAATAGALAAVRRAVALEPAEAMQPPSPTSFQAGLLEKSGVLVGLAPWLRMALRQIVRRPVRAALTVLGMSMAVAILVVANVLNDAARYVMDLVFLQMQREDVEVSFDAPRDRGALRELAALPGVLFAEPTYLVPVRLHALQGAAGPRSWEGALEARDADGQLRPALDDDARALPPLPDDGLVLTDELARRLDVRVGQLVELERLDGDRRLVRARVAGLSRDLLGLHATADRRVAARLLGEGERATGALLLLEPGRDAEIAALLKELPDVAGVSFRRTAYAVFQRLMAENFAVTRVILGFFASLIAVGIVYNSARITLAERARDLATLRVLGLTRQEIARIFLAEQLSLVALAIPVGWLVGRLLTAALFAAVASSDIFRFPLVTRPGTYIEATVVVGAAALLTALWTRRSLNRLDLIAVLKARE